MRYLFYTTFITIVSVLIACNKNGTKKKIAPSRDYLWGKYYDEYFPNKKDSAFYLLNRVVNNSKDSIEKADAYFRMGRIQLNAGDYLSAQASFLSGIKTCDQKDTAHYLYLAANYNALANASFELKDFTSAIGNYRLASIFDSTYDHRLYLTNNIGVTYQKLGDYNKSLSILDSAANNITRDTSIKGKIIANYARTKWLADPTYNPIPEFTHALNLLFQIRDYSSISSIYGHLSDFYEKKQTDSAEFYARKRLEVANNLDDPADKMAALSQLMRVGPVGQIKQFTNEFLDLNDSMMMARSKDRNQFALIRFDAEKSKADNLLLQKHIGTQRLLIWGTSLLGLLAIVGILIRARIRRIKLNQESENAIRDSRLKTSQKIHDVVANGLYRVMNELEHRETFDKEILLNKIEDLYEKSRDISYENGSIVDEHEFSQQVHQLLTAFAKNDLKVLIVGNEQEFWDKVTSSQKIELKLILEEMMINMQKHSDAGNVLVHFRHNNDTGFIHYKDDGVGFPSPFKFGNGLNNTVTRIKSMKGEINFEKSGDRGISLSISFPLKFPIS